MEKTTRTYNFLCELKNGGESLYSLAVIDWVFSLFDTNV